MNSRVRLANDDDNNTIILLKAALCDLSALLCAYIQRASQLYGYVDALH